MDSNVICPFYLWDTRYSQDSREKISDFMVLKILFYMQQLLMQTEFFEPVFRRDAIISDSLNHAPLLMGFVCVKRHVTVMQIDMEDLEQQLIKANEAGSRFKIIVTDGVFYGWCCCTVRQNL
jgi:glycine C-acetyltransferase